MSSTVWIFARTTPIPLHINAPQAGILKSAPDIYNTVVIVVRINFQSPARALSSLAGLFGAVKGPSHAIVNNQGKWIVFKCRSALFDGVRKSPQREQIEHYVAESNNGWDRLTCQGLAVMIFGHCPCIIADRCHRRQYATRLAIVRVDICQNDRKRQSGMSAMRLRIMERSSSLRLDQCGVWTRTDARPSA